MQKALCSARSSVVQTAQHVCQVTVTSHNPATMTTGEDGKIPKNMHQAARVKMIISARTCSTKLPSAQVPFSALVHRLPFLNSGSSASASNASAGPSAVSDTASEAPSSVEGSESVHKACHICQDNKAACELVGRYSGRLQVSLNTADAFQLSCSITRFLALILVDLVLEKLTNMKGMRDSLPAHTSCNSCCISTEEKAHHQGKRCKTCATTFCLSPDQHG